MLQAHLPGGGPCSTKPKPRQGAHWMHLKPYVDAGVPIVGLEPSSPALPAGRVPELRLRRRSPAPGGSPPACSRSSWWRRRKPAAWRSSSQSIPGNKVLVHGHCHQKAFDAFRPVQTVLKWIPGLKVDTVESSCCGMAGSFGYEAEHFEASRAMAELSLLPAVRSAGS
ncbi:hypothetical protein ACU4GD_25955 [Cupriavidus basilensis]